MSALWQFLISIFWNGTRRWLVLSSPPCIFLAATWLSRLIARLFPGLGVAPWTPSHSAWLWAIFVGLFLASYNSWLEQFNLNRTLNGRPDLLLECRYRDGSDPELTIREGTGFYFYIKNANSNVAVNITAEAIPIRIPDHILRQQTEQREFYEKNFAEIPGGPLPTEWVVEFTPIYQLPGGEVAILGYRIAGKGPMQQNVAAILPKLIGNDARAELPMTLVFSNLAEPARRWHAHYQLLFSYLPESLNSKFLGYTEIDRNGTCTTCSINRRKTPGC